MNFRSGPFLNALHVKSAPSPLIGLLVCVGAAALLSGCAGGNLFSTAPVDPNSPVAADVAKLARSNRDYPSFSEIPPVPKDVRPPRGWGQAATDVERAGARLEQDTAPGTWSLNNSDTFAAGANRTLGPEIAAPAGGDTEDYAKTLRERATPPPPPR